MRRVSLSGWAQPAEGLAEALGTAAYDYGRHAPGGWLEAAPRLDADIVVGWSLGGRLAVQAVASGKWRTRHLLLIAPPWDLAGGMGARTYELFRDSYAGDPERTAQRFAALVAKGDSNARDIANRLRHNPVAADRSRWLPWLDALTEEPVHCRVPEDVVLTIVHGTEDAVVPAAQSADWLRAAGHGSRQLWEGCGHAPHLHDAGRFRQLMGTLLHG